MKDALRSTTERAVSLGVFGAPSFVHGTELYFGNDHLLFMLDAISKDAT